MRLFSSQPLQGLAAGSELDLDAAASRHAQVRRVQPGETLRLFDGSGSDWPATVRAVGRSTVRVALGTPQPVALELPVAVTLALVMPANERMDTLVEKAVELGAAAIQPLHGERSVLRLSGERALRKREHWQGIAVAACEQCGRSRVPAVQPVQGLREWLLALSAPTPTPTAVAADAAAAAVEATAAPAPVRVLLSLAADARPPQSAGLAALPAGAPICLLSGPEGGLGAEEEALARRLGFTPVTLGPRVLRADTAPLALLAWIGLQVRPA